MKDKKFIFFLLFRTILVQKILKYNKYYKIQIEYRETQLRSTRNETKIIYQQDGTVARQVESYLIKNSSKCKVFLKLFLSQ